MKKIICVLIQIAMCVMASAQTTNVVVNGEKAVEKVEDKSYYINGVSSKEDIGGITTETLYRKESQYGILVITNHNPVPVTVNWETYETTSSSNKGDQTQIGSVTLQPNERKEVCHTRYFYYMIQEVRTITRKLSAGVDVVAELKKYKELLDAGIITQEEFATKKKEFLGL